MHNFPQYHERHLSDDPQGQTPIFREALLLYGSADDALVWELLCAEIDRRFALATFRVKARR
jgi:hypothetical protein